MANTEPAKKQISLGWLTGTLSWFLGFGSSLIITAYLLLLMTLLDIQPETTNGMMWAGFWQTVAILVYYAIQQNLTITGELTNRMTAIVDFVLSLFPLFLTIYALVRKAFGDEGLTDFEMISMMLWAFTSILDIVQNTRTRLEIMFRTDEYVGTRS